jgi:hypothetical protein
MHAALGTFYITTVKLIRRHIARLSQIHIVLRYVLRDKYPARVLPSPLYYFCNFFAQGDEFQAAYGMSSRTVERKAVSKAAMAFRPVSVSW